MTWIFWALLGAFSFGAYNFLTKIASGGIHQILGAVGLQASALAVGVALLAVLHFRGVSLPVSKSGLGFAALAGVSVGLAEILSFIVFSQGVTVTRATPILVGGGVVAAGLLALVFGRETLGVREAAGIALVVTGIWLLVGGDSTQG